MNRDDLKKAVVTGVITGVVGAVTAFLLLLAYVEFPRWYSRHYSEDNNDAGRTRCERPEIRRNTLHEDNHTY